MTKPFDGEVLDEVIQKLSDGAPKMTALLDAIRRADEAGELYWRLAFRWDYLCQATFHDDPSKAIPVAAEYSAIYEENPGGSPMTKHSKEAYLMAMEMGIDPAARLPQIPLEQYDAMLEKYRELTRRYGLGEKNYQWQRYFRWEFADQDQALQCLQAAWEAERDALSDCEACEHVRAVRQYLRAGDREMAERYTKPLVSYRVSPCESSFQNLWQAYLDDAMDRGDWEAAVPFAEKLQKKGNRDRGDLSYVGSLLRCWGRGNTDQALSLFSRRLEWTFDMWDQKWLYDFYKGAWVCFREAEREQVKLRLPERFPLYREDGVYSAPELAEWFYRQAADIGGRFDRRNGADYFSKNLAAAGPERM
ncbi:MAG: hypothetical protein HFJ80_02410 [Clostridiales bacterium]|nr:hypothetical protein [Clostridiales bacterium]